MGTPIKPAFGGEAGSASPTTNKGDLIVRGVSADERLAVGTDGQVPVADAASATGIKWETPAEGGGGTSVLFDSTLAVAAQTITIGSLGNLTEFNFELHIPKAVTATVIAAYINGDTTAANYRAQLFTSLDALETSSEYDDAVFGVQGVHGPSYFEGQVRLVDGHYSMVSQGIRHKSTTSDSATFGGVYRELTDTDFTSITIDSQSGTNLLPIGTRLIIRDPSATGAAGPVGPSGGQILNYVSQSIDPVIGPSVSANATKGQWIDILTNITVHNISVGMRNDNNAEHTMFIAKEAATAYEVESIVATSVPSGATHALMTVSGMMHFAFTSPFDLVAGEKYFMGIVRTEGATNLKCNIVFASIARFPNPDIAFDEIGLYTNNVVPDVGFNIGQAGTNNVIPTQITYVRT